MTSKILQELKNIETRYNVKILYACESGSRAWGFPSADSDYDVRFLYVHPLNWYLSIFNKRDVIELPVNDLLDINGWDLKKALNLLRKSNPVLLEWLNSPIVYTANAEALVPLRKLAKTAFLPRSACYHYLGMARTANAKLADTLRIRPKTYFYILRPLFCCTWIIERLQPPPMGFEELLNTHLTPGILRKKIDDLLEIKRQSHESDTIERSPELDNYIATLFQDIATHIPKNQPKADTALFDNTFREILHINNTYAAML